MGERAGLGLLLAATFLPTLVLADDVVVELGSGDRLVVKDSGGSERMIVEESSGKLTVHGVVQVGDDALAVCSGPGDEGTLRWKDGALEVCNGEAWILIQGRNGLSQSNAGASCLEILTLFPTSGDGDYWIDPNGGTAIDAFQVYCDMSSHGGGWTLLLNLQTSDATRRDYVDTTFWEGTSTAGALGTRFSLDFKSEAFSELAAESLMMWAHNDGAPLGTATYSLLPLYAGSTLQVLFSTLTDTTVTSARTANTGLVGSNGRARNAGDAFIDNPHALVINSTYAQPDATNTTRLGTRYGTGFSPDLCPTILCNGHNFGGWGGRHARFGWGADYEGAAINGYCATEGGFGSNGVSLGGNDAFNGEPGLLCFFVGHDVDMAVFAR